MKRIAFFLDNKHISSVNCRQILAGNPGIGGTEYLFIVVAYLLSIRNNGLEVKTFTSDDGAFPKGYDYEVVGGFPDAVKRASDYGFDCLIFKHDSDLITSGCIDRVNSDIKLIVWDHVFVCYWELDYYAENPRIYRIINVSREMNDLYIDHKACSKSLYIYNCVNFDGVRGQVKLHPFNKRRNIVVYVGALLPFKGFHLLAEAWPKILKEVPDAELYVIGSGRLYDNRSKLGKWGIADYSYENLFMQYLCENDKILPSVHFMGNMGQEKNEILLKAKVGVPNPSGITETFCISAVEMQMMGEVVTTIDYPGFLDTVKNGIIYHRHYDLAKNVIRLLKEQDNPNYEETMNFFEKHFSYDSVIQKWEAFLCSGVVESAPMHNIWYRLKWLKIIKRNVSRKFSFIYKLPPIERILLYVERIYKGRVTYIDSRF